MIRAMIVDDEPLARERIRSLLTDETDVTIVDECASGPAAVEAIRRHHPQLLFLDVQMPGMDGFGVLREVGPATVPAVVFVTAYDRYALEAFDYVALDYLLKPFDGARFRRALDRARSRIGGDDATPLRDQLQALLDGFDRRHLRRLLIRESGRITFVDVADVVRIEAQGNYALVYTRGGRRMVRRSMKELASRLDPRGFVRIHRSHIVNLEMVAELRPLFHGEFSVVLKDGTELTSNRRFKDQLQRLFGDSS